MKITFRPMTFETNSSSTHTLIMMSTDEYRAWKNGEVFYSDDAGNFITKEGVLSDYGEYVRHNGYQWEPILEEEGGWSEHNWYAKAFAESLNDCGSVSGNYGNIYIEDEGELNGVHGVCFYIGN